MNIMIAAGPYTMANSINFEALSIIIKIYEKIK